MSVYRRPWVITLACIIALATLSRSVLADESDLVGKWKGTLQVGPTKLRLMFHFNQEDDELTGSLDSIDQGANGIPLSGVKLNGDDVTAAVKVIGGEFVGTLDDGKQKIDGTWNQAGNSFPLVLEKTTETIELVRPQVPTPPFPYDEESVVCENNAADVQLSGTLTVPRGDGPFAAVVLVSGSGPQDRDEAIMGHRPFLILADHLTRKGIAVLRYDDRGSGKSTGDFSEATTFDLKDDALAAFRFLQQHPRIDAKKIGICGHSEGGLIAPLAAVEVPEVAFIILMAGPGVNGEQILYRQTELMLQAAGGDKIERNRKLQETIFRTLIAETDGEVAKQKVHAAVQKLNESLGDEAFTDEEQAALKSQAAMIFSPWFRAFLIHEPAPTLAKVKCPVLAINGEKDLQVDPEQNMPVIRTTLADADHHDFTIQVFPGLNHLFQSCTTGSVSEYGEIEETIAPAVLNVVSDWINARTR